MIGRSLVDLFFCGHLQVSCVDRLSEQNFMELVTSVYKSLAIAQNRDEDILRLQASPDRKKC